MDRFERRKEQKKESIRQAALELFKTYGFKKVSISEIAHKAGVSPVTIYNHFGSKDELVRDVIMKQFQSMVEKYRVIINGDGSFPEKLETIIFDKTQIASQFQGELAQTLFQNDPRMQKFVDDLWQGDVIKLTFDLLEEGKKQGYVNKEISQEALILYLQILRSGVSANPELIANITPNVEFFRELNNLFLYGLVGRPE
jgi:AcrR family transcriptional regulator